MNPKQSLDINRDGWNAIAETFSGTTLPRYGPLAYSEPDLCLIGNVKGKRVLEVGCGSGRSLLYLAQSGATELWGLDLSRSQIQLAAALLGANNVAHHLFESPMEENPGIPLDYFDLVVSIYALGWSVDLASTLHHIASYLKPDGVFVFSWEHPIYHCLEYEGGQYIFKKSYQIEGPQAFPSWQGVPIIQHPRKISTYINCLIDAGLTIERVIESDVDTKSLQEKHLSPEYWYSAPRARLIPTTMIVKVRKLLTKVDPIQ